MSAVTDAVAASKKVSDAWGKIDQAEAELADTISKAKAVYRKNPSDPDVTAEYQKVASAVAADRNRLREAKKALGDRPGTVTATPKASGKGEA